MFQTMLKKTYFFDHFCLFFDRPHRNVGRSDLLGDSPGLAILDVRMTYLPHNFDSK